MYSSQLEIFKEMPLLIKIFPMLQSGSGRKNFYLLSIITNQIHHNVSTIKTFTRFIEAGGYQTWNEKSQGSLGGFLIHAHRGFIKILPNLYRSIILLLTITNVKERLPVYLCRIKRITYLVYNPYISTLTDQPVILMKINQKLCS